MLWFLTTIRNQRDTGNQGGIHRAAVITDIRRQVTGDDRTLAEPDEDELRGRALLVRRLNLPDGAPQALLAGVVVAHLVLRVEVPELRGIGHRVDLHALRVGLLLQGLGDVQQQGAGVGRRMYRVVVRLGLPGTGQGDDLVVHTPRRVRARLAARLPGALVGAGPAEAALPIGTQPGADAGDDEHQEHHEADDRHGFADWLAHYSSFLPAALSGRGFHPRRCADPSSWIRTSG